MLYSLNCYADSRSDLALTNLQDVMENDLFGSSTQPLPPSSSNFVESWIQLQSFCSLLGSNSSLFNQSNESLNGFSSIMRKDLSPTLTGLSRLNPTSNGFILGSFDTDDYGTCIPVSHC